MKNYFIFILFCFVPKFASAQLDTAIIVFELDTPTVRYYLDTIRNDSFFLIEQTSTPGGGPRPSVFYNAIYFSDTAAFNQYISSINEQINQLSIQFDALALQKKVFGYRKARLEYLRDSIFRGVTGVPEVRSAKPPPAEPLGGSVKKTNSQKAILPDKGKRKKQR